RISRLSWASQTTARAACPLWASAAVTAVKVTLRIDHYFWTAVLRPRVRELVMLSALACAWLWWAAQGGLPGQPPGRSWKTGRVLLVSPRTNAGVTPPARLDTRDRDCARPPWHARRFVW